MIKNFVIDTNVMIHDPLFMYRFEDNNLIIPLLCIEELDRLKNREGIVGFSARKVAKELRILMQEGSVKEGIPLPDGGKLFIELNHMEMNDLPNAADPGKNDTKIIAIVSNLSKILPEPTILVTKDLYMQIKAKSMGIAVQDYQNDKLSQEEVYKGYIEVAWSSQIIDQVYQGGYVLTDEDRAGLPEIYPNQFFDIKSIDRTGHEILCRYDGEKLVPLQYVNETAWGLKPINREQKMAFEALMNPEIHFVSVIGGAGSGKTIVATAVGLQNVIETGKYRKLILVRPTTPAGSDIGFLPGEEKEKLRPWMGSFYDAIESLSDLKETKQEDIFRRGGKPAFTVEDFIEQFRANGTIEMKTFTYMRGRTFSNSLVIVDEAQEITPHIAKLMLTRAGKNSKFVFLGDPTDNQIDNNFVDAKSNGLVYTVEKMKPYEITAHVTLKRVERSPLAKIAEDGM